jgi:Glycosyl hydrolase family 9
VILPQRLYASQSGFAGYGDELAWAAANIYRATKEARYLRDARNFYGRVRPWS